MMTHTFWQGLKGPLLLVGLTMPVLANCGATPPGGIPGADKLGGMAGNCPDMASVDAIESFDFAKEFKLDAQAGAKLKAGAAAAASIRGLAAQIDGDLKTSCGDMAKDLGAPGDFKSGESACKAAIAAIGDVKGKMGANAKIALSVAPPQCAADVKVMGDCAAKCDANVKPGSVDVKCEGGKLQGECSAKCEGSCELSAAAQCTGECNGSCDAEIKGTCSGKCTGKCDGKVMDAKANGQCAGTCDGKCDGNVKAECKGKCGGSCDIKGGAECKGTCTGKCSVEMKAPKCAGKVEPPQMSAECKAHCDTEVQAKATCTPPHVALAVQGSADAKAEASLRAAVEKDMGGVLKVALGTGKHAEELVGQVKVVIDGAQASVEAAGDPMVKAKLVACVGVPFKGALDAVASVKANVSVSVNVQASASASGSAGGAGHAKTAPMP